MIGLCVAIMPRYLFEGNEGGMSNYGLHSSTVTFYTLALLTPSALILYAANLLPEQVQYRKLKAVFMITAFSLMAVLVTTYTYKHNIVLANTHKASSIWIFCFEILAGGWIALILIRSVISIALVLLLLIAFILASLTLIGLLHVLFIAQLLSMLSFGPLLVMSTKIRYEV
jgi:hypothetical protein